MAETDPVSFLGRRCPRGFLLRTLILQPRDAIDYRPADWIDTLLVVERGELEVECAGGTRAVFAAGAIVLLDRLDLRRLRSSGSTPLVLSALSRSRRPR
jgi:hypothetical protein